MKKVFICIIAILMLAGCSASVDPTPSGSATQTQPAEQTEQPGESPSPAVASPDNVPDQEEEVQVIPELDTPMKATIEMESGGKIELELYLDIAPQSVLNFCSLARQGYYDGLKFHRVVEGFMIQGGDPKGDGSGGPGYSIKGEFASNKVDNPLKHERGVLSMARQGDPFFDSAGSQFFIVHQDSTFLDGAYAAFGKVTSGMEVVDEIAAVETTGSRNETPAEDIIIKSITIEGPELPEPQKLVAK